MRTFVSRACIREQRFTFRACRPDLENAALRRLDVIAAEIAEDLQAALDQFTLIVADLKR